MSTTGLSVFDTTVQKSNLWLKDLMELLGWDQKQKAYDAMRAVLHALRDRLSVEEVAQLGAQLPMLIRGIYYEGWHPAHKPERMRHQKEFLDRVQQSFKTDDLIDSEAVVRAVFMVLENHISAGEIKGVEAVLSAELRELWPCVPQV